MASYWENRRDKENRLSLEDTIVIKKFKIKDKNNKIGNNKKQ